MKYFVSSATKSKLTKFANAFLLYFIVIYTFFMLGRSVWENFQLQKQISQIDAETINIQKQNKDLENLILYYKSDSFREVEARRKLGLKKPDEKVVSVPVKSFENFSAELEQQKESVSEKQVESKISNSKLWWQYFTK